jgi:DNA-directed RNA polymerase subunit RPC12/RpoP
LAEEARLREELQRMSKAEFVQHYNVLVEDLKRRGYSEQAIRKVLAEFIADPEKVRWVYKCTKCGREAAMEKPGTYYCKVCGPAHIMKFVGKTTVKELAAVPGAVPAEPMDVIRSHPAMHAVWSVLELDRTLTPTQKNVLWQDFVAAWNRRGLLTNEEAELAMKARFG